MKKDRSELYTMTKNQRDERSEIARLASTTEVMVNTIVKSKAAESGKINILILGHSNPNPDGDCCGSVFGLFHFLNFLLRQERKDLPKLEPEIHMAFNSSNISYLNKVYAYATNEENEFMSDPESRSHMKARIKDFIYTNKKDYEEKCQNKNHDVIIVLDTDYDRTLFERDYFSKPEVFINIDHHQPKSTDFNHLNADKVLEIINPEASSTAELILDIFASHTWYLTITQMKLIFRILKVGLYTDTGNFTFSNASAAMLAISRFVESYGVNSWISSYHEDHIKNILSHNQAEFSKCVVYKQHPCDRKIIADILKATKLYYAHNGNPVEDDVDTDLPVIAVTSCVKELLSPRVKPIDIIRSLDNVIAAAAFTLDKEANDIKVELRSETNIINCNMMVKMMSEDSGGHIQASGATIHCKGDNALDQYYLNSKLFVSEVVRMLAENIKY